MKKLPLILKLNQSTQTIERHVFLPIEDMSTLSDYLKSHNLNLNFIYHDIEELSHFDTGICMKTLLEPCIPDPFITQKLNQSVVIGDNGYEATVGENPLIELTN